jgi:hypothetical protein
LALNLKKLRSLARRRLNLKGDVEFKPVPSLHSSFVLNTTTNAVSQTHVVTYSDSSTLDPADVYHELCKAKLYELGFTTIESAAFSAMRDCSKDDPKYIRDASSAETIVLETYANTLLFKAFPESEQRRYEIVMRFESADALQSVHTQMGFWGTAAVCYYREASRRAGVPFPEKFIQSAVDRSSEEISNEYAAINTILHELPPLGEESISDQDSIKIIEVIVDLFSAKTNLKC